MKKYRIAVNGYGRIGRCIARALHESDFFYERLELAALNETADIHSIYHMTRFDSTHGKFPKPVKKK